MKFNLEKAQEYGKDTYVMQNPDPSCSRCEGKGIVNSSIQLGMKSMLYKSYCECTIKGLA